ncbi:hypothetical protein OG439_03535 [Amycolatopsis sp. NBC_01307]|uniref:hypothetical protein n=1 Tax=Amycolatopsis sp. NBC_01307 TaxID=2903561 RepID=UPI002E162926|nr:hypothetical protein OG439_03535 [Amycolatopsis sp. NBC_01307]
MSFEELMAHASEIKFLAIKRALDEHETEPEYARQGVDGYYQQVIEPLFKPFSRIPDPAGYQPTIDGLSAAMHDLSGGHIDQDPIDKNPYLANPTLEKMHTASDYLQDWSGQAAMLFKQKFLDPFPAISANQFILTAILKAALEAHQAMWAKTRDDIDKIAHATMDVFDNKCCDKNTWNVTFTVLSSIGATAAAVLTVATDGAAAPLLLSVVGAAAQVGATLPPDSLSDPPKGGGETALQIINSMKATIDQLTLVVQKAEAVIAEKTSAVTRLLGEHGSYFVSARPAVTSIPDGEITGSAGLGDSN